MVQFSKSSHTRSLAVAGLGCVRIGPHSFSYQSRSFGPINGSACILPAAPLTLSFAFLRKCPSLWAKSNALLSAVSIWLLRVGRHSRTERVQLGCWLQRHSTKDASGCRWLADPLSASLFGDFELVCLAGRAGRKSTYWLADLRSTALSNLESRRAQDQHTPTVCLSPHSRSCAQLSRKKWSWPVVGSSSL